MRILDPLAPRGEQRQFILELASLGRQASGALQAACNPLEILQELLRVGSFAQLRLWMADGLLLLGRFVKRLFDQ